MAMSFSRVEPAGAACAAVATITAATATTIERRARRARKKYKVRVRSWRSLRCTFVEAIALKHLVEDTNQPPWFQVVFHQALAEVPDAQLADRRGVDDVARGDVGDAHDAGEHHDLTVAVDLDLAHPFDDEVA